MKSLLKALIFKGLVQFGISTGLKSKAPKYILLKILAGGLFLVASIFALIALHQILRSHFNLPLTNLIFAGIFALVGAAILISVVVLRKKHQQQSIIDAPLRTLEEFSDRAQTQVKKLGHRAETAVQRHTGKALLGVALVALLMGRRSARK